MAWDLKKTSVVVAAVGALNWAGQLLASKLDLVSYLGTYAWIGYAVVGAAGAYVLYNELM